MRKLTDDQVAQIGKALGDPNRLAIYTQIAQCDELFCGEMHAKHTISAPTLSHHLKVLNVYYHVVPERFAAYLKYLADIGPKSR
jgi:ArsR family transcriptional regulator